uniref:hypothetical protein n=1 Tax=Brevundimonas nasdae TaxID=172043 RepID=UPI0028975ABE
MAKISLFPVAEALDGSETLPIIQGQKNKQVALHDLHTVFQPAANIDAEPEKAPLYVDAERNVPLWLEDGLLAFSGLSATAKGQVLTWLNAMAALPMDLTGDADLVPLYRDAAGNVPVWLESGRLAFSGLGPTAKAYVQNLMQRRMYGNDYSAPVATDGRTLFRWRAKVARLQTGQVVQPSILVTGDSWMDFTPLPQAIAARLHSAFGKASDGWVTTGEKRYLNGVTVTDVGVWTRYDASNGGAPPYGCGVDGQSASTTVDGARLIVANLICTSCTIHYQDLGGTFEYAAYTNGVAGPWTKVVCTGSGETRSVTISGLSD